jgi:hypothetical protein
MVVTRGSSEVPYYRGGETCFHCHHPVWNDTAIHWHGSDDQNDVVNLLFHPSCSIELLLRMMRDAYQIACRGGYEVRFVRSTRDGGAA